MITFAELKLVKRSADAVRKKYGIPVGEIIDKEFYDEYRGKFVHEDKILPGIIGIEFDTEADELMFRLRWA